jgi:hypothetical protein
MRNSNLKHRLFPPRFKPTNGFLQEKKADDGFAEPNIAILK